MDSMDSSDVLLIVVVLSILAWHLFNRMCQHQEALKQADRPPDDPEPDHIQALRILSEEVCERLQGHDQFSHVKTISFTWTVQEVGGRQLALPILNVDYYES